ncbi:hypothetical protein Q5425_18950 [Amycolatopsis sp. A133]|uniref:hypothetical protein n=1 Tax=Amycolatopsis sp. A133 TaxID=3064472 RepID=UPI0027F38D39|nr:hypothetical protein [Amycolatopsis sp. A133]MDQ7805829.1 hypothetical protein [Amycolatopsis sp. A133]
MLWLDLVDAMRTQVRNQVPVHRGPVRVPGLVPDRRERDVVEPVSQPLLDRPRVAGLPDLARVALLFQRADGFDDLCFGLAFDVSSVRLAVVTDSHGDAAVSAASTLFISGSAWGVEPDVCPRDNNCTSSGMIYCIQPAHVCSGTYYATNVITMLLPDGWFWSGPPSPYCTVAGGVEAYCRLTSTEGYIPPFI